MKLLFFVSKMGPLEKCRTDPPISGSTVSDPSLGQKKTFLWQCAIPKVMESFVFLWKM